MKITLKKVLYCGIALLIALCFFLMIALPMSVTIGSATYSGNLISFLGDASSLSPLLRSDVYYMVSQGASSSSFNMQAEYLAMYLLYNIFATIGLINFFVLLFVTIGAFFLPSMKGVRGLTIPFFAISIIDAFVIGAMMASIGATSATFAGGSPSGLGIVMAIIILILFIGMMIAPGVVKEKVFVDTKAKKAKKE